MHRLAAHDQLSAPLVAVLSNEFWRQKFHALPSVAGRTVDIDGTPTTCAFGGLALESEPVDPRL
ncbi:MAG TPA: hypothetical protein VLD17_01450 [Gemmatimonadaceae bacterium]|nr:hypothetical protein [Gemmatimonadaceae bacterium]